MSSRYLPTGLFEFHELMNGSSAVPKGFFYKWVGGFDFPEEMYEPIRILVETVLFEEAEKMRGYFFWGMWDDEAETIPANVEEKIEVIITPYKGLIFTCYRDHYKKDGKYIDRIDSSSFPSPFDLPEDESKHENEARFEIAYTGERSTQEERNKHKKVVVIDPMVSIRTTAIEVIRDRTHPLLSGY